MDQILSRLAREQFSINHCIMVQLNSDEAIRFYADKDCDPILPFLMEHLTSGPIVAMEVVSNNGVKKLIEITGNYKIGVLKKYKIEFLLFFFYLFIEGPENPDEAKENAPNSLRAKFGTDLINNFVHCSVSDSHAQRVTSSIQIEIIINFKIFFFLYNCYRN